MNISDDQLRTDRLVFYEKDVDRLDAELDGFLEFSKAKCVMLVDRASSRDMSTERSGLSSQRCAWNAS